MSLHLKEGLWEWTC